MHQSLLAQIQSLPVEFRNQLLKCPTPVLITVEENAQIERIKKSLKAMGWDLRRSVNVRKIN